MPVVVPGPDLFFFFLCYFSNGGNDGRIGLLGPSQQR